MFYGIGGFTTGMGWSTVKGKRKSVLRTHRGDFRQSLWWCKLSPTGYNWPYKLRHQVQHYRGVYRHLHGTAPPCKSLCAIYHKNAIRIVKKLAMDHFIAALFTIAKTWKQPVSINRWIVKEYVVYIDNGLLLSHKKEWKLAMCNSMDGPVGNYT